MYLTAIDAPSTCTTSKLLHPRWAYDLELSHGRSAKKGDLSISIKVRISSWHVVGHVRYVTIPDAGPSGQQLLQFEFNDCRGWNMGLHKEHVSAPESRGIELCNNAIQRYDTCRYRSHVYTNLTPDRHGKPFRTTAPVSQPYQSSRNNCGNHLPRYCPCRYTDRAVLRPKP